MQEGNSHLYKILVQGVVQDFVIASMCSSGHLMAIFFANIDILKNIRITWLLVSTHILCIFLKISIISIFNTFEIMTILVLSRVPKTLFVIQIFDFTEI